MTSVKQFKPDDLIIYKHAVKGNMRVKFRKYIGVDRKFAVVEEPREYTVYVVHTKDLLP